jgi:hypothetical protein
MAVSDLYFPVFCNKFDCKRAWLLMEDPSWPDKPNRIQLDKKKAEKISFKKNN